MKIVLATNNQGKVKEFAALMGDLSLEILTLADFPNLPEVVEDGTTFRENAVKKARETAAATGLLALADDSGLEVDYLKGAPGVYSARYAGPQKSDADNNARLLRELEGVPAAERTARFRCVIAVSSPEGRVEVTDGSCDGQIGFEPRGTGGFGYDPLFLVPEYRATFAELDLDIKNRISHRGRALRAAADLLRQQFN
ncbi:MAG TPA: XTP/dITP diphosphatase [Bacillota bacterium]|nr:XTP/dITP diphosphatase [Bacillota bacterium]